MRLNCLKALVVVVIGAYFVSLALFQVTRLYEEINQLKNTLTAQDLLRKQTQGVVKEELAHLLEEIEKHHVALDELEASVSQTPQQQPDAAAAAAKAHNAAVSAAISSAVASSSSLGFVARPPIRPDIPAEIWSQRPVWQSAPDVVSALKPNELDDIKALCGRCLYGTLTKAITLRGLGDDAHVKTGDIPEMWVRDSAVQISVYLGHIKEHPAFRPVVEGAIRRNAFNILQDPYANSYFGDYTRASSLPEHFQQLGRGGWVGTRNFEVDSGAYFFNLLWNYYSCPNLMFVENFLATPLIFDAVNLMVDTWIVEQNHETSSPYRYQELPRDGLGKPTKYTGMIWTGFRPSDDQTTYNYNIPVNMYAAGSLEKLEELNEHVWRNEALGKKVAKLQKEVAEGIAKFGTYNGVEGGSIYAYEVDGMGGVLAPYDDANVPSLLAVPLLGFDGYDKEQYARTRKWLLSSRNPVYYQSSATGLKGLGSVHTPPNYVWPLALATQGLTTDSVEERVELLKMLLKCQGGNGLMHEGVNVDSPGSITREWFEWANAMFVVFAETTTGIHCDQEAEKARQEGVRSQKRANPAYYATLEASIQYSF